MFTAVHGDRSVRVRLQVMGSHMVSNAMAALAVADTYGLSMEKAALAWDSLRAIRDASRYFSGAASLSLTTATMPARCP